MRLIARGALAVLALLLILFLAGPRERALPPGPTREGPQALSALLAAEAGRDLRPGVAAVALPAPDPTPGRAPLAVVYLHGFSATRNEIRPVPDRVADRLNAPVFYARLTGHGMDGAALAEATAADWMRDAAQAIAAGRALGDRVIVIGTSTGATLAALAALEPASMERVAGLVLVSPNFGTRAAGLRLLTLPWGRTIAGLALGRWRSWEPRNDAHARWWTSSYPSEALAPMAAVALAAAPEDFAAARVPALFLFSDLDRVVDPARTRAAMEAWGGPVEAVLFRPAPGDDPDAHVIAGAALSPGGTEPMVAAIVEWARGL